MELVEELAFGQPRIFIDEDMAGSALFRVNEGLGAVFSARCPGRGASNEDAAAVIPCGDDSCVLIVADGVGGGRSGGQAASLAIQALEHAVDEGVRIERELRDSILDGIEQANRAVMDLGTGAATTLAVVGVEGNKARSYHVGDSEILLVGGRGKVKLHTISHSPIGYGVEAGLIDADDALNHEERHLVSNVIGSSDMRIEIGPTLELGKRDTLLLASDGLSDNLRAEEIIETICSGALDDVANSLAEQSHFRMLGGSENSPSKPDDLTFVLYRRA